MGRVAVHYPHMMEVSDVFTACIVSMLRLAEKREMNPAEVMMFGMAHQVLADFMSSLGDADVDEWRKGIIVALEEIRQEDLKDGRDRQSNSADTSGNGAHHA